VIVLGVDSGSLSTGYGVVEGSGQLHRALGFGALRCAPELPHPQRLASIAGGIREVIRKFHPTQLAIEKAFVARNALSALKLGQVRGAVMVVAVEEGLDVREFSPNEVKSAVTGYGHAQKEQVQLMVKAILGLSALPKPHDAADALALALCALARERWDRQVAP
jgi:crossover junction endodeoxyribonuclease RuvC